MSSLKIMIVEDEKISALMLKDRLEHWGYMVLPIVFSGESAIETALETNPDLVLMDINLRGDMDGVEAAGRIRACIDIPVVYLTAYADEQIMERGKIAGFFLLLE